MGQCTFWGFEGFVEDGRCAARKKGGASWDCIRGQMLGGGRGPSSTGFGAEKLHVALDPSCAPAIPLAQASHYIALFTQPHCFQRLV
jgi:hypothetical protein